MGPGSTLRQRLGLQDVLLARGQAGEALLLQPERVEALSEAALLNVLDVLRHNVVALRAVPRQLVRVVPLKDVGPGLRQVYNDLQLTCVSSKVQRRPLLDTTCDVQVEQLEFPLGKHVVEPDHCVDAFLLALAHCCVQRRPVVVVLLIHARPIEGQQFEDVAAALRVLREDVHHDMQRGVAI